MIRGMETESRAPEPETRKDARAEYVLRLASNPFRSPLGGLVSLLAPKTPEELAAIFDNRVGIEAIRKWIEKRRFPPWAADLIAAKAQRAVARRTAEIRSLQGPGMGWNKTGLNEWRAKQAARR